MLVLTIVCRGVVLVFALALRWYVEVNTAGQNPYQRGGLRKGFGVVLAVSDAIVGAASVKWVRSPEPTTTIDKGKIS